MTIFIIILCAFTIFIVFSIVNEHKKKEKLTKRKTAALAKIEEYKNDKFDNLELDGFVLEKDEKAFYPYISVNSLNINGLKLDNGMLIITNERVLYIGAKKTRSYKYTDIVRKTADDENAILQLQNKKDTSVYNYAFADKQEMNPNRFDYLKFKTLFDIFYNKAVKTNN